ncbi:MAG: hypothetical protein IGBAC_2185 [Ignavibacteriae bacterium]|nr:MAG: hypothetical protein IGBAC_2185 [Ignavibacteriota bacterium]
MKNLIWALVPASFILGLLFSSRCENFYLIKDYQISTFSIVGYDSVTGDLGVAVQSKFPNVRPIVPWAEANVGAIATQSLANTSYGPKGLALLKNGATAEEALKILIANDSLRDERQVGIVDAKGNSATWTGKNCFDWAGGYVGENIAFKGFVVSGKNFAAQGNILAGKQVVDSMVSVYKRTNGSLSDKLIEALIAGGKAGGDRRGEQSAALLIVRKGAGYGGELDNFIDISVYDHPKPLDELKRLYELHKLYFFKSKPENLIKIDHNICLELQKILKDRGFYDGEINGIYDDSMKRKLKEFMWWENYDERVRDDDKIDIEVLKDIRKNYELFKKQNKK